MPALLRHLLLLALALAGVVRTPAPAESVAGPGPWPVVTTAHAHAVDPLSGLAGELSTEPAHEDDEEEEDPAALHGSAGRRELARHAVRLHECAPAAPRCLRRDGSRVRGPPRSGGAA